MEIILIAGLILLAAAAVVLLLAARQPGRFFYTRSAVIAAPPAAVFAQFNDFHNWENWSPWAALDPDAVITFAGPVSGTGASMSWDGRKTGAGKMVIIHSRFDREVRFSQEFYKPMTGKAEGAFILTPEGQGTRVTWEMSGDNSFPGKIMSLFINCEKMVGDQIEQGFANLDRYLTRA